MEQQLVQLLAETQSSAEGPRKHAESQLQQLYHIEAFPISLVSIATHSEVPLNIRQSALLVLKTFVLSSWSPSFDEFQGQELVNPANKEQVRLALLELATSEEHDRKVKSAASYVVGKIASTDFPDQWPSLLPTLLQLIPTGSDAQIHGALKVLGDMVEDGLSEEQFFKAARNLVGVVYNVAMNESRKSTLRALAISVFRATIDTLDIVQEDHKEAVKAFADETLSAWSPFFVDMMRKPLPQPPSEDDETADGGPEEQWRGLIALKLQVVKTLMKIRSVFPTLLSPQSPTLFTATWQELSALQAPYQTMYINDERQGRLEDADGLPYTLDFLVLEELDFMQSCLRAPPVRKELEGQLQHAQADSEGQQTDTWVTEVMKLAVAYAQITTEEEGLWDIDVNIFLSEETSVTANYTPRTACGDLVIKLAEWLNKLTTEGLLAYTKTVFTTAESWKPKESALYILNQVLNDFMDVSRNISPEIAKGYSEYVEYAMHQDNAFLRARGYLVAGVLTRTSGTTLHELANGFLQKTLNAVTNDPSDVVKASCVKVLQDYLQALPRSMTSSLQGPIISAISAFLASQDLAELVDSDDVLMTLVETLRDAMLIDARICIGPGSDALNLLFSVASHSASNFQITALVNETFEEVAGSIGTLGGDAYIQLCEKVLPSLAGAFDVGDMTQENALRNLAAELLSILSERGTEPLPNGFIAAVMPRLNRLLLSSTDAEFLRPGTEAVKYMLAHDHKQMFEWHDENGKSGLEVCLIIIDRLLGEKMEDHAAAEVGGLAAELVEKAGSEKLGPFLLQLLKAVAVRLASAKEAAFIQSLILVFARLSLVGAKDVVDFLAQVQVGNDNGLQVVMGKWLENSVNFAGYDEIRQNVIALSKLFSLEDQRLVNILVQGDLIVPDSDRIMTRSKARSNPDRYTIIPVPLKIIKVLIQELSFSSGESRLDATAAADLAEEGSDD
ncbi:hypothetical protein GP486_002386, partial [Trichoglossum hirsutum]